MTHQAREDTRIRTRWRVKPAARGGSPAVCAVKQASRPVLLPIGHGKAASAGIAAGCVFFETGHGHMAERESIGRWVMTVVVVAAVWAYLFYFIRKWVL